MIPKAIAVRLEALLERILTVRPAARYTISVTHISGVVWVIPIVTTAHQIKSVYPMLTYIHPGR